MKRNFLIAMGALCFSFLAGCSSPPVPPISGEDISKTQQAQQELSNEYTAEYYRTIIPYVSSPTRGLVYSYLSNRYDIEEFELALMRHSQSYFAADQVYFQEGQHFTKDLVRNLLARKKTDSELTKAVADDPKYVDLGLNPSKDVMIDINGTSVNPVYLAYMLEQDYVVMNGDGVDVQGISIGLALNPYQTFKNELGYEQTIAMDESELITKGKELAQSVVDIVRAQEGLENVELMIGLYVLQEESSVTPGRMVAKTHIPAQSDKVKNWTEINEKFYLLPDQKVQAVDYKLLDQFNSFKDTIKEYYPHYYGVIGIAHFVDDSLTNLEITINIDFYGLAEKLSFHQLVSKLVQDSFSNGYEINVVVRSTQEIFGIVNRQANEKEMTLKLLNWD
ncbi:MAG: CamS family sex pheromone protein [Turicibacter sp.]